MVPSSVNLVGQEMERPAFKSPQKINKITLYIKATNENFNFLLDMIFMCEH